MILMTARLIKILLFLAALLAGSFLLRRKINKKRFALFAVLVLIFAIMSNAIVSMLPSLTDEVTLTALGKKRNEALKEEVYFASYTIDGKTYLAGKCLEISDGKWFWSGETYAWRIETDTRQPAGTTRSITVRIPVGWSRTLDFAGNQWRGMVEISTDTNTWIADTFSEENKTVSVQIGRSQTSTLIWNQMYHLALYGIILIGMTCVAVAAFRFAVRDPRRSSSWLNRNSGKLTYAGISVLAFFLLVHYAGDLSLWADELLQIKCSMGTPKAAIQYCLNMRDATPPLYTLLAWGWYRIAPFGEKWLLMISILPTVAAIYMIGLTGEKLGEKYCGILASCITAFSTTVWACLAFEFRSYAFVLLFSSLSIYNFIQKNQNNEQKKWMILYSISLLGLTMSHYFGMLACALFCLADLVLYIEKKVTWRLACGYIIPAAISLVWLYLVYQVTLKYHRPEALASWYPVPHFSHIKHLLYFLTGNFEFSFCLLLLAVSYVLVCLCRGKRKDWTSFYQRFFLGAVCVTICTLWLYGNFVNQKSTMWQERYFIFLLPMVSLLIALVLIKLGDGKILRNGTIYGFICLLLISNCLSTWSSRGSQPFRQSADWLYKQSNHIFNKDTIIITTITSEDMDAWEEYYVCRKGRRDGLNIKQQYAVTKEELDFYDRVYVQYSHLAIGNGLQAALEEAYELEADHSDIQMKVYVRSP